MTRDSTVPASCASCGLHHCHQNVEKSLAGIALDRQAWLLDEAWAEFNAYLTQSTATKSLVLLPWRGKLLQPAGYAWRLPACARISAVPLLTLRRSLAMRRLSPQGARRQQVLEDFDRRFAAAYGARLPYNVHRLVVWQNLLPFLHLDKTLGGREYDVLLWRAPRHVLHERLGEAQARYPESRTLTDYRSSPVIVEAERRALEGANQIVTAHSQLARLYPEKTEVLNWNWPAPQGAAGGRQICFLGPTVGRRGAYVVREAMRKLGLPLAVLGKNLEDERFWDAMNVVARPFGRDCLGDVGLLLAPALTEYKPRLLMQALQRGIKVIATEACGLPPIEGLHVVDPFDSDALAEKIEALRPR